MLRAVLMLGILAEAAASRAQDAPLSDSGRLLAAAGAVPSESAAAGGLVAWADIAGDGTRDAIGADGHDTRVNLSDVRLQSAGVSVGRFDRVGLSLARPFFETEASEGALGPGCCFALRQSIGGVKLRLFGSADFDQESLLPRAKVGSMVKFIDSWEVLPAMGARAGTGTDVFLAAPGIPLDRSLLLDAALRMTRADRFGLPGFGGPRADEDHAPFEGSAALLLSRRLATGVDYRSSPGVPAFAREGDAYDAFLAYFLNRHLSATLAYVDAGSIATRRNQQGVYLSLVGGF